MLLRANNQANRTAASAGGVAGYAENCTISNCYNYGTITATGFNDVASGGIVGKTGFSAKINSCHNSGNISGENVTDYDNLFTQRLCLGGIVGWLFDSSSSVTNCSIKDGIKIDASYYSSWLNEKDAAVGHIVGKGTEGSGNTGTATIIVHLFFPQRYNKQRQNSIKARTLYIAIRMHGK